MAKLIIAQHISLDGYLAGPNGEMDWINFNDELFDFVGTIAHDADTAFYGRKTFEMMDFYWPTAGQQEKATKHDKEHSDWYNRVDKIVLSNSMLGKDRDKVRFINDNMLQVVKDAKKKSNVLTFGSPGALQPLFANDLIDEMHLFVNPVLLGNGIQLFRGSDILKWQLKENRTFKSCNVVGLHYSKA
jgi:dihydrofolate reductase